MSNKSDMDLSAFNALQQFFFKQLLGCRGLTSTVPLRGHLPCPGHLPCCLQPADKFTQRILPPSPPQSLRHKRLEVQRIFWESSTRGLLRSYTLPWRSVLGCLQTHSKGRVRPFICPDVAVSCTDAEVMGLFSFGLFFT